MNLSRATTRDLEEVLNWISAKRECQLWAGPAVSYPIEIDVIIDEIGFHTNDSYVYRENEKIIAFGQIIRKSETSNHLARIITNPDSRGKGYGLKLCKKLVSIAGERGDTTTLNVFRNNHVALTIYENLGFKEDSVRSTNENVFMVKLGTP